MGEDVGVQSRYGAEVLHLAVAECEERAKKQAYLSNVHAGEARVMDLLKELETVRKEKEHDPIADTPTGESQDISNEENSKAVLS